MKERGKRRGKERGWMKREKGGWILPSVLFSTSPILPFFPSLFPLMSVLSIGSQCVNRWLSYTHIQLHYITHTLLYLLSFCQFASLIGSGTGTEIIDTDYVVTKKSFIWNHIDTDHIWGQEIFFLLIKEMDCIAFIPTDHISWHVVHI